MKEEPWKDSIGRLRGSRNCAQGKNGQRHDVENVERDGTKKGELKRQGKEKLDKGKEDPEAAKNHPRKNKGRRSNAAVLYADCTRRRR